MTLPSFDTSVVGVRCLADFALSSLCYPRPTISFVSSVSVVQHSSQRPVLEGVAAPYEALGSGYSESKWVAEQILENASLAGLSVDIIRVGQLCGGVNGCWNRNEWIPTMICSSRSLGCIPDIEKDIALLRVVDAAKALNDFRHSQSCTGIRFLHLAQPRLSSWSSIAHRIADRLQIPLVAYHVWINRLKSGDELLPVQNLVTFFENADGDSVDSRLDAFGMARIDASTAIAASPSLQVAKSDLIDDVELWLKWWGIDV